jgi:hypothetical protein
VAMTDTDDEGLLNKICIAMVERADAAIEAMATEAAAKSKSKVVARLLREARKRHPAKKDFEAFLKRIET